jgi:hypothetical protein
MRFYEYASGRNLQIAETAPLLLGWKRKEVKNRVFFPQNLKANFIETSTV